MAEVITTVRSLNFNCGNVFTGEQSEKGKDIKISVERKL